MTVLTTSSVAQLLDCEETTVQTRATTGDLPGIKIGRSWVFPEEALMRRLNEMALEDASRRRVERAPAPPLALGVPVPAQRSRRNALPACLQA